MKEVKDPEIRLFGKKIALPENGRILPVITAEDGNGGRSKENSIGSDSDCSLDGKKVIRAEVNEDIEDEKDEADKVPFLSLLFPINKCSYLHIPA